VTGVRTFARNLAALAAIGLAFDINPARAQTPPPAAPADVIYYNGVVVTMDPGQREAQAVAVTGANIIAVGSNTSVDKFKGSATKLVDLKGKTIVPGFIDTHSHLSVYGYLNDPSVWVDISSINIFFKPLPGTPECATPTDYQACFIPVRSQDDVIDRLKTAIVNASASNAPAVLAFNYDPARLGPSKGCADAGFKCQNFENGTSRETLDKLSTEVPIYIESESGHVAYVNSKALEMLKICGAYDEKLHGQKCAYEPVINPDVEKKLALTGQLDEDLTFYATSMFQGMVFKQSEKAALGAVEGVRRAAKMYASRGFTLTQEGAASGGMIELYDAVTRESGFPTTAAMIAYDYKTANFSDTLSIATDWKPKVASNPRLFVAGVKSFADGSPQAYTAFLGTPYFETFAPFTSKEIFTTQPYVGLPDVTGVDMTKRLVAAHQAGFPLMIHQNGAAAVAQSVAALVEAQRQFPSPGLRDIVLHAPMITPDEIMAVKKLGNATLSFLMGNLHFWGQPLCQQVLGGPLAQSVYPASLAVKAGVPLTMHHDSPVTPPDPLFAMWVAKTRKTQDMPWYPDAYASCPSVYNPGLAMSIEQGLKAYTIDAAWQYGRESTIGSISAGKIADLAILSDNPLKYESNPDGLLKIKVLATVSQGRYFDHATPAAPVKARGAVSQLRPRD
jgi:predicted amidohydrolase YtcJ